tara:strand:+ start:320 stop:748 length:429 start_codon:yes stop_codon:yes gene_type:complete
MGKKRKPKYNYVYVEPTPTYLYNSSFDLCIKPSSIKHGGLGVFINENISGFVHLGNYTGEVKHDSIMPSLYGSYALDLKSENYIDASDYPRSVLAMINDARFSEYENNCEFIIFSDRAEVWSTKEISIGEELFVSYGKDYWS